MGQPERFLIPIQGLRVPRAWRIGNVVIHPASSAATLLTEAPPIGTEDGWIRSRLEHILTEAEESSLAEVRASENVDDAADEVRAVLDALRVFQLSRGQMRPTAFGLAGDVYESMIEYIIITGGEAPASAPGFIRRGDPKGWTFGEDSLRDWDRSKGFQFLSEALEDRGASEGARRAAIGVQLLARATREHRADLKMLGTVATLEALLLDRSPGPQTRRLARYVSWFGCGQHDNDLCGRDRPICPYLHLQPSETKDRERLQTLRKLGNTYVRWRCSEWHRVTDWYDARSGAAHGDPSAVDGKEATSAQYWTCHYLLEPILEWLADHRTDPVRDLENALNAVEDPAGWGAMLTALDAATPPVQPPPFE